MILQFILYGVVWEESWGWHADITPGDVNPSDATGYADVIFKVAEINSSLNAG